MKILVVSDEEEGALWEHYRPGALRDYDLILSCGDLKPEYLRFLVTMGRAPLLYVHGNHDESYDWDPPEGCDCIDFSLVTVGGLRILGLAGCLRYRPGKYQYSEAQMRRMLFWLRLAIRRAGGVDLIVCHAPPRGLGDLEDPAHRGFQCLRELVETCQPGYLLHGHVHSRYERNLPREHRCGETLIINACGKRVLELEAPDGEGPYRVKWLTRHKEPDYLEDTRGFY